MTDTPWETPWIGLIRYRLGPGHPWATGRVEYLSPEDYGIQFDEVWIGSQDDERALSAVTAAILASAAGDHDRAHEIAAADRIDYSIAWGSNPGAPPRFVRRRGPFARRTRPEEKR